MTSAQPPQGRLASNEIVFDKTLSLDKTNGALKHVGDRFWDTQLEDAQTSRCTAEVGTLALGLNAHEADDEINARVTVRSTKDGFRAEVQVNPGTRKPMIYHVGSSEDGQNSINNALGELCNSLKARKREEDGSSDSDNTVVAGGGAN